jgi:hypothetical protein
MFQGRGKPHRRRLKELWAVFQGWGKPRPYHETSGLRSRIMVGAIPCGRPRPYSPSRHKNPSSTQLAGVEIPNRIVSGLERVNRCMQGYFALGCQRHQLSQIIVGSDEVADEVDLG